MSPEGQGFQILPSLWTHTNTHPQWNHLNPAIQ